jgi:hypothetical protein
MSDIFYSANAALVLSVTVLNFFPCFASKLVPESANADLALSSTTLMLEDVSDSVKCHCECENFLNLFRCQI